MPRLPRLRLVVALLVLFSLTGCAATQSSSPEPGAEEAAPAASSPPLTQGAYVFVDGKRVGTTPKMVTVRRSFGTREVSLHTGPKFRVVRTYELETARSASRTALDYSFNAKNQGGVLVFDADDLPTRKKGAIRVVPYYSGPIRIEDREYQLTLYIDD